MIFTESMMEPYFQALERCKGVSQMDKHHPEGDVFNHSLQVLRWAFRESDDTDLILAAMLHDVGKALETKGHEKKTIEMLDDYLSAKTKWLIEQHMRIWSLMLGEMRRLGKVRELVEHSCLPDLILLARWDKMGRDPKRKVEYDKENIIHRLNRCVKEHWIDDRMSDTKTCSKCKKPVSVFEMSERGHLWLCSMCTIAHDRQEEAEAMEAPYEDGHW